MSYLQLARLLYAFFLDFAAAPSLRACLESDFIVAFFFRFWTGIGFAAFMPQLHHRHFTSMGGAVRQLGSSPSHRVQKEYSTSVMLIERGSSSESLLLLLVATRLLFLLDLLLLVGDAPALVCTLLFLVADCIS